MSNKKNWRRCVSLSARTFVRLRRHCTREGRPMAGLVETLVKRYLDREGEASVTQQDARQELGDAGEFEPSRTFTPRDAEIDEGA